MNHFNPTHYVPIVRWRKAERTALAKLTAHDSTCLTPLVELVPENFKLGAKVSTIDQLANEISCQLFRAWSERPFFIDLHLLSQDILTRGSSHFLTLLGNCARNRQLSLIPVTGRDRDDRYQSAVLTVLSRHNKGACFRLSREDIQRPTLTQDLDCILSFLKIVPEEVDLLVDFRVMDSNAPAFTTLCNQIPHIHKWRNFIVASGAFPEDLSGLEKNRIHKLERLDWISWRKQTIAGSPVTRMPIYSDYTIQYALYLERTGQSNYSASIRYTAGDYWVIMRGESVRNEDGPGTAQWPANAQLLCEQDEYCKETFSDGDMYIKKMSLQSKEHGNPTTWLQAGINHHMTFVVRQLANLFETSAVAVP
jgi:hypothetical protein